MKYLKMLGLAAVAAAALMAFAGPAGATTLTSPAGTIVKTGTTIHAEAEGHAILDSVIGKIECGSTVSGPTANEGGTQKTKVGEVEENVTEPVEGSIEKLEFTGCTTAIVKTLKAGSLKITSTGGNTGSLSSTGAEVTVETFGLHCIFSTNGTAIGTVTGSPNATSDATLDISATIPRTSGRSGAFCGSSAPWTGSYRVTSPTPLFID